MVFRSPNCGLLSLLALALVEPRSEGFFIDNVMAIFLRTQSRTLMKSFTATQARKEIYNLIDKTAETHEPIQILGKRTNAVLINESDWNALQETVYLLGIPGMADSIKEGLATPIEDCETELEW